MKKGAPKKAVITPTGISAGARSVLARMSDESRKIAPINAEAGKRTRWSGPTRRRVTWGMMSPTKPIVPAKATDRKSVV